MVSISSQYNAIYDSFRQAAAPARGAAGMDAVLEAEKSSAPSSSTSSADAPFAFADRSAREADTLATLVKLRQEVDGGAGAATTDPDKTVTDKTATGKTGEDAGTAAATGAADAARRSGELTFEEIASRYNINNITPNEIDELAEMLRQNDAAPSKDILMLETHGAEFHSYLQEIMYEGGYTDLSPESAEYRRQFDQPVDVLQQVVDQREMAMRRGDPTEGYDEQLRFLNRFA